MAELAVACCSAQHNASERLKSCSILCRETQIPADLREEFLSDMAASKFSTGGYNLLENNCNNFSNDFASFLTGKGIPVSLKY